MLEIDASRSEICKKAAFVCKIALGKLDEVHGDVNALVIKAARFS